MKAGLILFTLSLVAVAQAGYELSCTKSELSIRWPSYESNSEYYVCSHLFGHQMTVTCNPGEVFTFVLQSCTAPNRYIPAPAIEVLPTSSPLLSMPNKEGYQPPKEIENQPPAFSPPVIHTPGSQPLLQPATMPMAPIVDTETDTATKHEETKPIHKEEIVAEVEEPVHPLAPLPPTPAPTPPVVEKMPSRKPNAISGKKPSAKKKKSTISDSTTPAIETKPTKKSTDITGRKPALKQKGKINSNGNKVPKKAAKKPAVADKKS